MKIENYDHLKDQVKFTGFGEGLENELKKKMESGADGFTLSFKKQFGKDDANATLHFRLSDQGNYFFNKYDMSVKQGHRDTPVNQTFYINKDNTFTMKEAFNLLSGRAVNKDLVSKEGQKYNSWVQLDFKETEDNGNYKQKKFSAAYGYNLEEVVGAFHIKELKNDADKDRLFDSLKKGNQQSVTFINGEGKEEKSHIEASPQYKSINIYDEQMHRIRQTPTGKEMTTGEKQEAGNKKSAKNKDAVGDDDGKPKKRNSRKVA